MDVIYNWIKNIVIYMILNTIIMNMLGNSSYKKYVSIVSGMILVLIVASPLMNMMKLDEKLDYFMMSNDLALETSSFQNELSQIEDQQKDAVFLEYEDKIRTQVEQILLEDGVYLTSFELNMDQDIGNSTYGEILGMEITAEMKQEDVGEDAIPSVDEIEIAPININKNEKDDSKDLPSPMEINIKKRLSDFYYIEPDNINISIQGG